MIFRIFRNSVKTGAALALTTTAATILASHAETGKPWAAVNAISHIVDGDEVQQPHDFDARATAIGLAINATAMVSWAVLFEAYLELTKQEPGAVNGLVGSAATWIVDYKLVPKRLTPGIEKRLTAGPILAIYAVLGTTLALSSLWRESAPASDRA